MNDFTTKQNKEKQSAAVYVFIDASNVWNAVKSAKKFIEYKNLYDLRDINEFWGKDLKHRKKD